MSQGRINLSLIDAATLLLNVHRAARDPAIGFEDADNTLGLLVMALSGGARISIKQEEFESAAWCANMLSERGEFWHPRDRDFDYLMSRCLPQDMRFDRTYNRVLSRDEPQFEEDDPIVDTLVDTTVHTEKEEVE